ncbi:hypothetical protein DPMN_114653 [Dreissena polymorpha]|uniref:Uncharacterized protein n=1 Tax=Dreissena polymorpha TaxID=45954 RepID=A0A9D4KLD5_DREPO|nr:hypothetical protein DPMN_114653 [Dreissena polymorpha]
MSIKIKPEVYGDTQKFLKMMDTANGCSGNGYVHFSLMIMSCASHDMCFQILPWIARCVALLSTANETFETISQRLTIVV